MRKNFGAKTWLYPMPVLIIGAYNEKGEANAMNVAWGGISEENEISVCISSGHKTTENIMLKGAFTISIPDVNNVAVADYLGIVSGNNVPDKTSKAGLHSVKSEFVDAPVFSEFAMTLECRLVSYDKNTCRLVGEIVNVSADESIIGDDGLISLSKFSPITFDPVHHSYVALGEKAGNAFSDGKTIM